MTQDEIIEMARDSGMELYGLGKNRARFVYHLEAFAKLVVAKAIAELGSREPVAYDKTELNCFAQDLYDQKMREGKRGHYESMFHVIHQCVKKVAPPPQRTWVGLTDEEIAKIGFESADRESAVIQTIDKLKERNA